MRWQSRAFSTTRSRSRSSVSGSAIPLVQLLADLLDQRQDRPHGVVDVVGHGAGEGDQRRLELGLDRLPLERHVEPRVADRHRRRGQEALDDRHVPAVERPPLPAGDLEQAQELAAEIERRAEQARRRRDAASAVIGQHLPERIAAAVAGQPPDARAVAELARPVASARDLVPHEGALPLRPDDLLGLDAEDHRPPGRQVRKAEEWS